LHKKPPAPDTPAGWLFFETDASAGRAVTRIFQRFQPIHHDGQRHRTADSVRTGRQSDAPAWTQIRENMERYAVTPVPSITAESVTRQLQSLRDTASRCADGNDYA
jgi:hypothetical protein